MKTLKLTLFFGLCLLFSHAVAQEQSKEEKRKKDWENFQKMMEERFHNDWPWLGRYKDDNAKLDQTDLKNRVGFIGDSITDGWDDIDPGFFKDNNYINRGIGGQTTPQMLVRFRADIIDLKPKVVVILAGTNDVAGNTGPSTNEMIEGNIKSMVELAKANAIKVVLCSILPAKSFPWKPGLKPAGRILELNTWLKQYAKDQQLVYVDYHAAMADHENGLPKAYSEDGVHPNSAGYEKMKPLVLAGIKKAFASTQK